jgi:integrase
VITPACANWAQMGYGEFTAHGFRSTFRDWAGETTAFPREIAEAALGHQIGNAVEQAYRRGDALAKRRKLMDAWATFCASPPTAGATVTPIRAVP